MEILDRFRIVKMQNDVFNLLINVNRYAQYDRKSNESKKIVTKPFFTATWTSRMTTCHNTITEDQVEGEAWVFVNYVQVVAEFGVPNLEVLRGQRIQECHHARVNHKTVQKSCVLPIKKFKEIWIPWNLFSSFSSRYARYACVIQCWIMERIICRFLVWKGKKFKTKQILTGILRSPRNNFPYKCRQIRELYLKQRYRFPSDQDRVYFQRFCYKHYWKRRDSSNLWTRSNQTWQSINQDQSY